MYCEAGEDDAARALLPGYDCYITHVQETTPREHRGAGVAFYIRRDSVLARNGRLLPSAPWDRAGMVGQYSCDVGVIVGAYLPTPTKKDAALREALDDEYPLLVKSHGHRLLCFCGDLNATLSRTLDSTKWFHGDNYNVRAHDPRELHQQPAPRRRRAQQVARHGQVHGVPVAQGQEEGYDGYWQARPDHFLVPQGRASRVEDVVVPDGEQWVRHIPAPASQRYEEQLHLNGQGGRAPAARTYVPIVVTMRRLLSQTQGMGH